jgi:hypothetical protein
MVALLWTATNLDSSRGNVYAVTPQKKQETTTVNLNSSKSNIYRLVYDARVASQAQANALLAKLDKLGPADETKLKVWLPANFKSVGIQETRLKKITILLEQTASCTAGAKTCKGRWIVISGERVKGQLGDCRCYEPLTTRAQMRGVSQSSPILILLLADPKDEAQALAVSDPGKQGAKGQRMSHETVARASRP